ncbi:MAG: hypothetical protein J6B82_05885 [Bacteroidaceae bacterium]|nr:hypothetical protein [Bacteroidaceae bacterium]
MKEEICVAVFTAQDRHFDEFDRSYLPLFHSIYGVYEDMNDALNDVYTFLYSGNEEEYEVIEEHSLVSDKGEYYGHEFTFKYTDKKYGGYALYELLVQKESVYGKGYSRNRIKKEEQ